MSDLLKLIVPGKPEYVGTVRLTLSSLASSVGFDIEAIEDIKVAVSEACTNIIRHAHEGEEYNYGVTCEVEDGKITISVEDDGRGYDVGQYEEPDLDEINEGGLGIFIIKALMDEVSITSEVGVGTHIKMTKTTRSAVALG
ncbi:MAG: ATP-binding protein [Clostridiales Family XIII bacterium]|jgi:serine/threonine-protein kinase RsbW|nr:ATP-binding protein [Clostridiales Family XIII bacterium]